MSAIDLCEITANLAICIATLQLTFLLPNSSCRLIALDKCPGVRPIVSGEVIRQIFGRTIFKCVKTNLKILVGDQQLCMGQKGGIEHAIHFLIAAFKDTESKAILLVHAKNAFNSLNRDHAQLTKN